MLAAAVARGCVVDLARVRLHVGNELLEVVDGQRRIHHEHAGLARDQRHRDEIVDGIEGKLRIQACADRVGLRCEQQRIAVGGRLGDDVRTDRRTGAGLVVHDDALTESLRQLLGDHAHRPVDGASRRKRNDDADGSIRIALRGCGRRTERAADRENEEDRGARRLERRPREIRSKQFGTRHYSTIRCGTFRQHALRSRAQQGMRRSDRQKNAVP